MYSAATASLSVPLSGGGGSDVIVDDDDGDPSSPAIDDDAIVRSELQIYLDRCNHLRRQISIRLFLICPIFVGVVCVKDAPDERMSHDIARFEEGKTDAIDWFKYVNNMFKA